MSHYETVLAHGTVLTMDADYTLIPDGAIAFSGNQIAAVGPAAEVLTDADAGEISISTKHASPTLRISDIGMDAEVFEAGGLERILKVHRLPDTPHATHLNYRLCIPVAQRGDTPVFVRVTQIDGHKGWSSPIYLYRG